MMSILKRLGFVLGVGLLLLPAPGRMADASDTPITYKGRSYAAWGAGLYLTPDSDLSLAFLAETGSNWISLVVTAYQDNLSSTTIFRSEATPTDEDLVHAIARAHALGLKVLLKPHLDLWNDPDHWRGEIGTAFQTEAEWRAWFEAYRGFITPYADLARSNAADMFCVGTELEGTTFRADDWRDVVAGVRTHFGGPLIYAANHSGEETGLSWWDALDIIGVDAYYQLASAPGPSVDDLKAGWLPHRTALANLAARWQKPVVFTEIGYRSIAGTASHPWDWQIAGTVNLQEQADAYQAVLETFVGQPWFEGMFWWSWGPDPFEGGPCDDGYSPHDKPAEGLLRTWYDAPQAWRPEPPLEPDYSRTMDICSDGPGPGWEDQSWGAQLNLFDTERVYKGVYSAAVKLEPWGSLSLGHAPFFGGPAYRILVFALYVPEENPPHLWAFFYDRDGNELVKRKVDDCRFLGGGTLQPGAWNLVSIPLRQLGMNEQALTRICLQDSSGQGSAEFWVDDLRLVGAQQDRQRPEKPKRDGTAIRRPV